MKTNDVLVKKSSIHGSGVFAGRDFKAGEIVLRWDISNTLPDKEVAKMTEDEKRYISYMDGKYIIMQNPEKYVNHSCDSNTTAKHFCDIAKRDIAKGEEITADYKEELPPNVHMRCNCGSKKCVGIIES
jgi:SET domain-containing protein